MLRLGIIALLVAASCARVYNTRESVYKPGREYTYKYESQAITGIPKAVSQGSGLKVFCDVRLQFSHNYKVVMQLENIELYEINAKLSEVTLDQVIPRNLLTEVPRAQAEYLSEWLSKPVEFRYEDGEITKLLVKKDEPYFTVNIKKGILSILNIDLTERNPIERVSYKQDFRNYLGVSSSKPLPSVYRVYDDSVVGECESVYEIVQRPEVSGVPVVEVKKAVNLDRCVKTSYLEAGPLTILTEENKGHNIVINLFDSDLNVHYKLNGDRRNFVIEEAELLSKYVLTPFEEDAGVFTTFIRQSLTLKDVAPVAEYIKMPYDELVVKDEPIQMEIPSPVTPNSARLPKSTEERRALINKVYALLHKIEQTRERKVEETPYYLEDLLVVLAELDSESIIRVIQRVVEERKYIQKEILLDIIPTLTSPEVIPVVINIITNNIVSSQRGELMLNMAAVTVTPTSEVVTMLLPSSTIMREEVVRSEPSLYQTLLLTSGSLVHRLRMLVSISGQTENHLYTALFKQVVSEYRDAFYQSEREIKFVILKAIGNSGLPEFLPFVEEVLQMENIPTDLRVLSVFALRRVPEEYNIKVQNVILPVFMDTSAPTKLRISSCVALLSTEPELSVLRMMVHAINRDHNKEFVGFVYRHMTSIARREVVSRNLKKSILRVMKLVRPVEPNYVTNTIYNYEAYLKPLSGWTGISGDIILMSGKSAVVPEHIVEKIRTTFFAFGRDFDLIEMGTSIEGLSDFVKRILVAADVIDEAPETITLDYILNVIKSQGWASVMKKVYSVLTSFEYKEFRDEFRDKYLSSYIKLLGNELRSLDVNIVSLVEALSGESVSTMTDIEILKYIQRELLRGYEVDVMKSMIVPNTIAIPTPMGLPLSLNITTTAVLSVKGTVKAAGIQVSIWDMISGNLPEEIALNVHLRPRIAVQHNYVMGLDASVLKTGAEISIKAEYAHPVLIDTKVYPKTMSLVSTVEMTPERIELLKGSLTPSTFITKVPVSNGIVLVPSNEHKISKQIDNPVYIRTDKIEIPVPVSILGLDLAIEKKYPYPMNAYTSVISVSEIRIVYEPRRDVPRSVDFVLSYVTPESNSEGYNYRTEPRVPYTDLSVFEEVQIDESIHSPRTYKILYSVVTNKQEPVAVRALTTLVANSDLSVCQINNQIYTSWDREVVVEGNAVVRLNELESLLSTHMSLSEPVPIYKSYIRIYTSKIEIQTLSTRPDRVFTEISNTPVLIQLLQRIIPEVRYNGETSESPLYKEDYREFDEYFNQKSVDSDKFFVTEMEIENVNEMVFEILKEIDYYLRPYISSYISWLPSSTRPVTSNKVTLKSRVSIERNEIAVLVECPAKESFLVVIPLPSVIDPRLAIMEPMTNVNVQRMSNPLEEISWERDAVKCMKKERTYFTEMTYKGRKEVCFSTEPVELCPVYKCEPVSTIKKTVRLHCLDASLDIVQQYKRLAKEGVVEEMDYKRVDRSMVVEVPKVCVARGV